MVKSPVAYIIFNRPRHTRETFEVIRSQRPARLFIIADGPRSAHPDDVVRCREVRKIVEKIDWPCEVYRNYADKNLGLKLRVSSGLNWVFEQVERAIVLEDDCLPHPDFFLFCDELLDFYAGDERVWVITGNNFQNGRKRGGESYYFSKYNHCWGWATWRRAWNHYSGDLPFWEEWKYSSNWRRKTSYRLDRKYWTNIFDKMSRGEINTWDYPWTASVWYHGGLTATPNVNLVTNIGFGPEATHTRKHEDQDGLPRYPLGVVTHPKDVTQNRQADRYAFDHHFGGVHDRFSTRLLRLLRQVFDD